MKVVTLGAAAVAGPAFGPAIITLFGQDIPIMAMSLSIMGLLLARAIAPPPLRKLNKKQEAALTCLLLVLLFLVVTGQFGNPPLGAGTATAMGIGLGFSGLLAIEFFGEWAINIIKTLPGMKKDG